MRKHGSGKLRPTLPEVAVHLTWTSWPVFMSSFSNPGWTRKVWARQVSECACFGVEKT